MVYYEFMHLLEIAFLCILLKKLSGGFAEVHLAEHRPTGMKVIKIFSRLGHVQYSFFSFALLAFFKKLSYFLKKTDLLKFLSFFFCCNLFLGCNKSHEQSKFKKYGETLMYLIYCKLLLFEIVLFYCNSIHIYHFLFIIFYSS